MKPTLNKMMRRFVKWVDPKLEKYRKKESAKPYTPKDLEDLLGILKRTPKDVLNAKQRRIISNVMSFDARKVKEIMIKKDEIVFVHDHDMLGPLMLDRLYRSGHSHFPVLDKTKDVVGILHTDTFNSLENRNTDRVEKYLDRNVYYVNENYSLEQALAAFVRTNCYFFIVINKFEEITGLLPFEALIEYLLGNMPDDSFAQDADKRMVAKR